jgi:hypothetical protein
MEARRPLRALEPTVEPDPIVTRLAPRLDSLDGKVVGLLANGKRNGDQLLDQVAAALAEQYRLKDVRRWAKPNVTRPAPAPIFAEMVEQVDLVITAIGD